MIVCVFVNFNISPFPKNWTPILIISNRCCSFVFFECELVFIVELKKERFPAVVRTLRTAPIPFARSETAYYFNSTCLNDCQRVPNVVATGVEMYGLKPAS